MTQKNPDPLLAGIARARRRLALKMLIDHMGVALLAAFALSLVWLIAARVYPALGEPLLVCGGIVSVAFFGAVAWTIYRLPSRESSALELDQRLGLRERVTSSLSLAQAEGVMIEALHRDARRALGQVHVADAFPLVPSRAARWVWAPVVAFGIAYVALPEFDLFNYRERQAEALAKATKQEEAAKLIEGAAALLKKETDVDKGAMAEMAEKLKLTAAELKSGELTEKQALAKVSDVMDDMAKQQNAMAAARTPEAKAMANVQHPELKKVLQDLQNGKPQDAAKKLRELQEKLKNGELSEAEKQKLQEGMQALQKAMQQAAGEKGKEPGESSDKKSANGKQGGKGQGKSDPNAGESGETMELSLEDLASSLEQLDKMQQASAKLSEWKQSSLGPSKFCRQCGKALKPCNNPGKCKGTCPGGACQGTCDGKGQCKGMGQGAWKPGEKGQGNGMGGPGQGAGGEVGDLPEDASVNFQPTTLPGEQTQGKILTEITERTSPVADNEAPTVEVVSGGFEVVQQQAEEALNQEEIPAGSKEFVRQYFGVSETSTDPQ